MSGDRACGGSVSRTSRNSLLPDRDSHFPPKRRCLARRLHVKTGQVGSRHHVGRARCRCNDPSGNQAARRDTPAQLVMYAVKSYDRRCQRDRHGPPGVDAVRDNDGEPPGLAHAEAQPCIGRGRQPTPLDTCHLRSSSRHRAVVRGAKNGTVDTGWFLGTEIGRLSWLQPHTVVAMTRRPRTPVTTRDVFAPRRRPVPCTPT
jgi:hypothetical protein